MWFNILVLFTALTISGVAAYYSIIGLTAIFAAAFWPIVIMGGVLEFGKIVTSVWLKKYWHQAGWQLKSYLTFAVAVLMLITSMGIFGFLSKAHLDQAVPTGDVAAKVSILDEQIKTERDNIEAARKALTQMDAQVNERLSRSTDDKGAERAVQIRRQQAKERQQLQNEIAAAQKRISTLNEQRAPIASELRKVEAEVGPIKYIAALIYDDNPDANLLERAVRWVIIIIVAVFDPLAIALILAANSSMRWEAMNPQPQRKDEEEPKLEEPEEEPKPEEPEEDYGNCPKCDTKLELAPGIGPFCPNKDCDVIDGIETVDQTNAATTEPTVPEYLTKPWVSFSSNAPQISNPPLDPLNEIVPTVTTVEPEPVIPDKVEPIIEPPVTKVKAIEAIHHEDPPPPKVPETAPRVKVPIVSPPEALNVRRKSNIVADNAESKPINTGFGIEFPKNPHKGDMFLRVDRTPNAAFKFNGDTWIEVDKTKTDINVDDDNYIQFLVDKLSKGEYELDQLSPVEQDLVARKLIQIANEQTQNINTTPNT